MSRFFLLSISRINFNYPARFFLCLILSFSFVANASEDKSSDVHQPIKQILMIRHGEKPELGLGQLNCRGLNRALALPKVLIKRFGSFDALIVPNPGAEKKDKGVAYSYARPLATVEPLAIYLGKPVEATIPFNDLKALRTRLDQFLADPQSHRILVVWEHKIAEQVVRDFLVDHQAVADVPHWDDQDFDSIYLIEQTQAGGLSFSVEKEKLDKKLDKLSDACPKLF